MKKIYLLILTTFLFAGAGLGQVTVTNPTNTIPSLSATYPSLASAITALNAITSISAPVIITLNAGNPETAPVGGYVIQFSATTSAGNNITIEGSNNTITSSAALTVGALNDGFFKLVGADFVTLQHFTMQENAANTNTAAATNNMTEWGVALLHTSATNGAQNNTIQNNTIALNRSYANTFGIYSNVRHTPTNMTTVSDITNSTTAPNHNNKIYSNNISNVNMGIAFIGSGVSANQDAGNDIGGSSAATGNAISDWGGAASATGYISNSLTSYCIFINHQTGENVSYNTLTSATVSGTPVTFRAINKDYTTTAPAGTFTSTISFNTITMLSDFASGTFQCIASQGMNTVSTVTVNITNNNLINSVISDLGTSSAFTGIIHSWACGTLNITNNVIRGNTSTAITGGFTGIQNSGSVVNAINITGNQLGNAGGGAISFSSSTTGAINCINNSNAGTGSTININNNSIDGISVVNCGQVQGLVNTGGTGLTINMNNNQLGSVTGTFISYSGAMFSTLFGIVNNGGTPAATLTIQGNDIKGIVQPVTGTGQYQLIVSNVGVLSQNVLGNTFTNLTLNTTNGVYFIVRQGTMNSGASWTCSNNSIVTGFNKPAPGNNVEFLISQGGSVNGSTMTETGNNFSNVTVTGGTTILGWNNAEGVSTVSGPVKTISNNVFSNITGGSGTVTIMYFNKAAAITSSFNTISNITGSGNVVGMVHEFTNGQGVFNYSFNTISSLASSGNGVFVEGFYCNASVAVPTLNINNNDITGLSSPGANAEVSGIDIINGATSTNIYDNTINNLTVSGSSSPRVSGIFLLNGTTINMFGNKINTLQATGAVSTTSGVVNGLLLSNGVTVTAYNNFIADLQGPAASLADAIRGIAVTSMTPFSTYNLYYNSIYLNAGSGGSNFGTSGIYHISSATATTALLNMIDNIVVNTSTPNGTGLTAAYRRSGTTLTNYASTSDHNLFYAGTPGPARLIYYDGTNSDQTLSAYKTRVSTRDANSISVAPNFTSATDLHLTATNNCAIDGYGTPVAGITADIDAQTRDISTPDIGADEFTAAYGVTPAGITGSAVCENKKVSVAGTVYATGVCDVIAKLLPSGADPFTGKVNVCVTLDAAQQYFNGEPYVQRHFDLEPATSNQTTTSATVTLYFTDGEFALYNANNPVWPPLPTLAGGANSDPSRANVKVTQFHGAAQTSPSSPGNYPGARVLIIPLMPNVFWNGDFWEISFNVLGFSGFYVHTNHFNAPLPVSINYFTGTKQGSDHLLNWKVTCNSTTHVTITLERSGDSRNFSVVSTITADAVRCNQPFEHIDTAPLEGMNYYRLKIEDLAGKISYSGIVALLNAVKGFDIISLTPNPVVNNNFILNVTSTQASKIELVIIDMQGRLVNRQAVRVIAGFNSLPVSVGGLAAGTYLIYGTMDENRSGTVRFVKQ